MCPIEILVWLVDFLWSANGFHTSRRDRLPVGRSVRDLTALACTFGGPRGSSGAGRREASSPSARCPDSPGAESCGGSMYVKSRSHIKKRAYFYGCTSFHLRGSSVCANSLEVPMPASDVAVLSAIEQDVLRPEVVTSTLRKARRSCSSQYRYLQNRVRSVLRSAAEIDSPCVSEPNPLDPLLEEPRIRCSAICTGSGGDDRAAAMLSPTENSARRRRLAIGAGGGRCLCCVGEVSGRCLAERQARCRRTSVARTRGRSWSACRPQRLLDLIRHVGGLRSADGQHDPTTAFRCLSSTRQSPHYVRRTYERFVEGFHVFFWSVVMLSGSGRALYVCLLHSRLQASH